MPKISQTIGCLKKQYTLQYFSTSTVHSSWLYKKVAFIRTIYKMRTQLVKAQAKNEDERKEDEGEFKWTTTSTPTSPTNLI